MRPNSFLSSAITLLCSGFALLGSVVGESCTALANGFEAIDDSPAINDALKQCGNGGTIILPADQYYSLHTTLDFSFCHNCDVQIEGKLIVYPPQLLSFAAYNRSVFNISNAQGVTIRSLTGSGVVDGNALSYYQRTAWTPHYGGYPFVHVTNSSTDISFANLHFKNIQDRVFLLQGNSSFLSFDNLRITAEGINGIYASFDNFAFEMGEVTNVSISNVDIAFTPAKNANERPVGTCMAFDHGTDGVRVQNVTCRRAWMGAEIVFSTIFPYIGPRDNTSSSFVSNLVISNFTFAGAHATGVNSWWNASKRVIRNVTWEWVTVEEGTPADFDPCYSTQRSTSYYPNCLKQVTYDAKEIYFRHFRGKVGTPPTDPNWGEVNGLMEVETVFEDWVDSA